jgi:hypothetical protein
MKLPLFDFCSLNSGFATLSEFPLYGKGVKAPVMLLAIHSGLDQLL